MKSRAVGQEEEEAPGLLSIMCESELDLSREGRAKQGSRLRQVCERMVVLVSERENTDSARQKAQVHRRKR